MGSTTPAPAQHEQELDPREFAQNEINNSFGKLTTSALEDIQGRAEEIPLKGLRPTDIIFAVIGPSGAGKSTFIKELTGFDCEVGHGIVSCTETIQVIRVVPENAMDPSICFIDTPGFDATERSDLSTFEALSQTLISICKQGLLLSGLLYFHRISDVRMGGTPLSNIRFFSQLCSTELSRLVYVTTMWDLEDPAVAEQREKDLVANYWRPLIKTGCTAQRFLGTKRSGLEILLPLIRKETERRSGMEMAVKHSKMRTIIHGGEILASLLVERWQQLRNTDRFRRQIRKMSSLGSPLIKEVSSDDILVLVVGPSGAGKTHFINLVSERPETMEHQLTGSTQKVQIRRVHGHPEHGDKLVMVDTPAIGAYQSSEAIGRWITKLYRSGARLSGIVSLYGISDSLVYQSSVAIRMLHLYLGLAIPDYHPNMVAFVTTGWDKMESTDETLWEKREKSYLGTVCEGIIQEGKAPTHFHNTVDSARSIVQEVIECDRAAVEESA